MKTINIILAILVSIASVMAYGGGGGSFAYFKVTEDKKTGVKLTHYDTSKKTTFEHNSNDLNYNLYSKGLKYVDVYETNKGTIFFRTSEKRTIMLNGVIPIDTNTEYNIQDLKTQLVVKQQEKAIITFMKHIKKEMFGMQSKGTYLVTTQYGTTQVSLFE